MSRPSATSYCGQLDAPLSPRPKLQSGEIRRWASRDFLRAKRLVDCIPARGIIRLGSQGDENCGESMQDQTKGQIQRRLKRIAGQVAGLQKMVDENRYCVDILTQVAAVRSALDAVGVALLADHVQRCVFGHGSGKEHECARKMTQEEVLDEVRVSLKRFLS